MLYKGEDLNKIMKLISILYVLILVLIVFANIPLSKYKNPIHSDSPLAISVDSSEYQAVNKEAHIFLEPVVQLYLLSIDEDGPELLSSATGFSVAASKDDNVSYLLSNNHFCADAIEISVDPERSASITYTKGTEPVSIYFQPSGMTKIVFTDPSTDLCLMEIREYIEPVIFQNYNKIEPVIPVKIVGAPGGIFPVIFDTYISGITLRTEFPIKAMVDGGRPYLFISGIIIPGSSGSPIFNKNNKVIGIVFATPPGMFGGIAIQGEDVQDWLDDLNIKYKTN